MALYLMCIYASTDQEKWLRAEWAKTGKNLDMGKSCIRFKKLEDLPVELIGRAIARVPAKKFIAACESQLAASGVKRKAPARTKAKR